MYHRQSNLYCNLRANKQTISFWCNTVTGSLQEGYDTKQKNKKKKKARTYPIPDHEQTLSHPIPSRNTHRPVPSLDKRMDHSLARSLVYGSLFWLLARPIIMVPAATPCSGPLRNSPTATVCNWHRHTNLSTCLPYVSQPHSPNPPT